MLILKSFCAAYTIDFNSRKRERERERDSKAFSGQFIMTKTLVFPLTLRKRTQGMQIKLNDKKKAFNIRVFEK